MSTDSSLLSLPDSRAGEMFPTFTDAQMDRALTRGRLRSTHPGEILHDIGDRDSACFVVKSGRVEVVRTLFGAESVVADYSLGQFTGEVSLMAGRPSLGRARVVDPGEVIEISREDLRTLVQTDAELGDIFLRAFILRRMALIANPSSDVVVVGSSHSGATLEVKEFLTRNGQPYRYLDVERESDIQELLDRFQIGPDDIPVVICRGDVVLRHPTNEEIADCLGMNEASDPAVVHDLVIIGAGPAGLGAAVYAASEGLDVQVIEGMAPGGQAGTSSRIENYLGFPNGISGQELASRAANQALKFGARFSVARHAARIHCDAQPYAVETSNGECVRSLTILLATGVAYRRLGIANLAQFEGTGIYYSATFVEAQVCGGEACVVVGGGNSAGQAAVFLSQTSRHVYLLVRSDCVAKTMSEYLVRRIRQSDRITLLHSTEIVSLEGGDHLERVSWCDKPADDITTHDIRHVFVMTGAVPSTGWLDACVVLDENGFVKTGTDLTRDELRAVGWPLSRPPYLLETSRPGVFAVGDVRCGSIKRVASAVGEGANAIAMVHQALREL